MKSRHGESICLRTDAICTKIYANIHMSAQVNLQFYLWQDREYASNVYCGCLLLSWIIPNCRKSSYLYLACYFSANRLLF